MSCSNSNSKCNPCGPSADAMNEIANKSAYYARIAQYASNEFNTIYLGAKDTAPTLDNDGNALIVGALYFNTVTDIMYSWDGTIWISAIAGANTATTDTNQTITGVKTFTQPIVGSVTGNAATATTLATSRTFNLSGDVTGIAQSFNGSANVSIPSTIANDAVTSAKIINDAVTNAKIQNLAVTVGKLGTTEQTRIAKAWVNFNGTTSPGTIASSYNVSSVTKNGTGDYSVNFTTAMADANYSVSSMASQSVSNNSFVQFSNTTPPSTSSVRIVNVDLTPVVVDSTIISVQVFGN
jgi:hypothetical protein